MLRPIIAGAALAAATLIAATAARADHTTVSMCTAYIVTAQDILNGDGLKSGCEGPGIEIGGGNPYRTCKSLNSKLETGITKLDQAKPVDAYQALSQFVDKLYDLDTANAKGLKKINGDMVGALITAGEIARDCTAGLAFGH